MSSTVSSLLQHATAYILGRAWYLGVTGSSVYPFYPFYIRQLQYMSSSNISLEACQSVETDFRRIGSESERL